MNQPVAPVTPRQISAAPIQKIDPKDFGKKAELKEKLVAILKDVPVLHDRLVKLVAELEKSNAEFKAATDRAKAIVDEWEKIEREEKQA
jgi:hypothetical protein